MAVLLHIFLARFEGVTLLHTYYSVRITPDTVAVSVKTLRMFMLNLKMLSNLCR